MQRLLYASALALGFTSPTVHAAEPVAPASRLTVGGGLAVTPDYVGGGDFRLVPLIAVDYQHASGFFASTGRGIGYQIKSGPFALSGAVGIEGGRRERDRRFGMGSDALRGMGDVKSSATANFGITYTLDNGMSLGLKSVLALSNRERGNHYQLGLQKPLLSTAVDQLGLFAMADYADAKYMQTFHGVTVAQSVRSGYRAFEASAGFQKVGVGLNWNRKLSDKWSANSTLGVFRLVGDAADSPLTQRKTAPMYGITFNYSF